MGCLSTKSSKKQKALEQSSRNVFPSIFYLESDKLPAEIFKAFQRIVRQTVEKSQMAPERPKPVSASNKDPGFGDYKFSVKKTQPAKPPAIPVKLKKKVQEPSIQIQEGKGILSGEEVKDLSVEFEFSGPKEFLQFQQEVGRHSPLPPNVEDSIMEENQKKRAKRLEKEAVAQAKLEQNAFQVKQNRLIEDQQRNEQMQTVEDQANKILSKYQ